MRNDKNFKITLPHDIFEVEEDCVPNVRLFLIELRTNILCCTIQKLVYYMNWSNDKYYDQIINGYKSKDNEKKFKKPTVDYLFSGLNHAFKHYKEFKDNKDKIMNLIFKYLIKF